MGRLIGACLLGIHLASGGAQEERAPDWNATWDELERVLAQPERTEGRRARLVMLAARERTDARGRLLAAWLERAAGRRAELELGLDELAALGPRETWLAARVLAPGPALERALIDSLAQLSGEALAAALQLAFDQFVALSAEYEELRALALARAMHARAEARWSATNLATGLRRAGRFEEAYELLTSQLPRAGPGLELAALHQDRALVGLGAGWEARARDDLGAALARGSPDAAVVLGRMALAEGQLERARRLFGSLLREQPPQAWALRGWGLSMLPRERERL